MINGKRYKAYRKKLLRKKELLLMDLGKMEREAFSGYEYAGFDDIEQGTFGMEKEIQFFLLSNNSRQLSKIDDALERMEMGKYGRCRICSKKIAVKRLRIVPFAEYCVECQEEYERETAEEELQTALSRLGRLSATSDNGSFALARTAAKF